MTCWHGSLMKIIEYMQQSHLMPLQCGLSVDYWPLALRQLFNLTCRYSRHPKIFAIWIANFSWFRKPDDFTALFGWWRKLKKFAMKIAKSTYITVRISLPLLQTLPSFIKREKLCNGDCKVRTSCFRSFTLSQHQIVSCTHSVYQHYTIQRNALNTLSG